jgi:hypothetical protein
MLTNDFNLGFEHNSTTNLELTKIFYWDEVFDIFTKITRFIQ